jgi:hypothetical protein
MLVLDIVVFLRLMPEWCPIEFIWILVEVFDCLLDYCYDLWISQIFLDIDAWNNEQLSKFNSLLVFILFVE